MTMAGAEKAEEIVKKDAEEKKETGPTNVFGTKLQKCGTMSEFKEGKTVTTDECPYTENMPQMCVAQITRQFEPKENSFEWEKQPGADNWPDGAETKCVSIWDLGENGFFGQAGLHWGPKEEGYGTVWGWVPSDYLVKCDALPSDVLTSQYTLDTYSTCEFEARQYKYISPNSKEYSGTDQSEVTKKSPFYIEKPSKGEEGVPNLSTRCERFRKSVGDVCNTCINQAKGAEAKAAITSQCESLYELVPVQQDARTGKWVPWRIVEKGMPWNKGKAGADKTLFAQPFPDAITTSMAALMGLFVVSGAAFAIRRFRRSASTVVSEPLLPPALG